MQIVLGQLMCRLAPGVLLLGYALTKNLAIFTNAIYIIIRRIAIYYILRCLPHFKQSLILFYVIKGFNPNEYDFIIIIALFLALHFYGIHKAVDNCIVKLIESICLF